MNMKSPVFICGALRSGSTLFHLMLDSHPDINNPGEFDFLFDKISDNGVYPDVISYIDYLSSDRIFNSKGLKINKLLSYSDLIHSFVDQNKHNNKYLAMNIHRHFDRAYLLFPDAKYIHLLRDPRDVARSSIGMNWAGNVYYGVDHWFDTEKSWDKLSLLLRKDQWLDIRFEDLISDTENTLEKVCGFMGVQYTNKMLSYQDSSTYSKPDSSLINQWQRKLSTRELQNVESKVVDMMIGRNYELSGNPLEIPGLIELIKLGFQNKLFKVSKGMERYGVILYILYRVTGKISLTKWHKVLLLRISEIDKDYLK